MSSPANAYALGHSAQELERLELQSRFFEPLTRQFLRDAGLERGMRVLDVGSGFGDVAFLATELVGSTGEVVGIDTAAAAVAAATDRARQRGVTNVRFVEGDAAELTFDRPFDAAVGRLVLFHCPDPAVTLRAISRHVRAGGLIAFQDLDLHGFRTRPHLPLHEQCMRWAVAALAQAGAHTDMGLALYDAYVAAGLPPPELRLAARVGAGPDSPGYRLLAGVVRSLLPAIERAGLATAAEVDIDTLADRLRAEALAHTAAVVYPPLGAAWVRKP